jgi:hypothetical protein
MNSLVSGLNWTVAAATGEAVIGAPCGWIVDAG